MTLLETLVVGSYVWSFLLAAALYRKLRVIELNHLRHLERKVRALQRALQQQGPGRSDVIPGAEEGP